VALGAEAISKMRIPRSVRGLERAAGEALSSRLELVERKRSEVSMDSFVTCARGAQSCCEPSPQPMVGPFHGRALSNGKLTAVTRGRSSARH
jgi:hypothetical protein